LNRPLAAPWSDFRANGRHDSTGWLPSSTRERGIVYWVGRRRAAARWARRAPRRGTGPAARSSGSGSTQCRCFLCSCLVGGAACSVHAPAVPRPGCGLGNAAAILVVVPQCGVLCSNFSPTAVALSQWAQVPSRAFGFLGTSVCPCRPYCRLHCGARLLAGWARHRRDTRAEALCLRAKPPRNIRVTHKLVVRHARTANLSSTGLDVFSDHAATAKAIHAAENTQQSCRTAPRFWGLPQ